MNKRLVIIMLAVVLLVGMAPAGAWAAAQPPATIQVKTQPIGLVFDGQELKLPVGQYSFIYQGRTYMPIRYLSYALQKTVGWDGDTLTVYIDEPTEEERAELKEQLVRATAGGAAGSRKPQESVALNVRTIKATLMFDGVRKDLPQGQSVYIYNGSIYVPVRFLAEAVGTEIGWDPVTRTVSGESAAYRAEYGDDGRQPSATNGGNGVPEAGGGANGGQAGSGSPDGGAPAAGGGGVGGGGGAPTKLTYERITADAEASLESLRASCMSRLMDLGLAYLGASEAAKPAAKAKINQELASCTAQFEAILADASAKLTANGYSTDIINEYRAAFEAELEAGRRLAESMS